MINKKQRRLSEARDKLEEQMAKKRGMLVANLTAMR